MFYFVEDIKTLLRIPPSYMDLLGKQDYIKQQLVQKVEGRVYEEYGYIICVIAKSDNNQNEKSLIEDSEIDDDGYIKVTVVFNAITFNPKNGEVIDCVVDNLEHDCIKATIGPADVMISKEFIGENW